MSSAVTPKRRQSGSAILLVLGGLVLASALAVALLGGARSATERARAAVVAAEARHIAEALIHRLAVTVSEPVARSRLPLDGTWIEGRFLDTQVRFRVRDERGKIDLNHALPQVLGARLLLAGVAPGEVQKILDAWADWRDADDDRRLNGAEAPAYDALGLPQRPRNGPLKAVEEFRQVLGVSESLFESVEDDLTVYSGAPTVDPWVASPAVLLAATGAPLSDIDRFVARRSREQHPRPPASIIAGLTAQSEQLAYSVSVEAMARDGLTVAVGCVISLGGRDGPVFRGWR